MLPRIKRTLYVAFSLCMLAAASAQTAPWHDALDAYLSEQVEQAGLAAVSVAVASGDDVLYARGFGQTEIDGGAPVTPSTAFEIGSLTKSMTALAVLRLHEAGTLDIDEPVRTYLSWFRVADEAASEAITLRHLLSHTSGLSTVSHGIVWTDHERIDPSVVESVRALSGVELNRAPGEGFEYANMGYSTLGAVIEAVADEPWADHVTRTIFEPLGMDQTAAIGEGRANLELAQSHTWRLGQRVPVPALNPYGAPAGSMTVASASDMAAYLQAWLTPREGTVVTPAVVDEAFRAQASVGTDDAIGLGWFLGELHGERVVFHSGGTVGATSNMALLPDRDLAVIVLTNSMSSPAPAIGRGVLDIVLGQEPAPIGPDVGRWTSYVLTGISVVLIALLVLLVARVARRSAGGGWVQRRWLLALRAVVLSAIAAGMWVILPALLTAAGMPAPFGIRGYPFDVAVAALLLLSVPTAWAVYALGTLMGGWGRRVVSRRARRTAAT